MGWGFDESRDAHQEVYGQEENKAKFSHELIGGAAAFEAMKLYEDRQRKEGKVVSHGFAKELLVGLAGAEVDRLAETKGMDEYDKIQAKRHAESSAKEMYDNHYGGDDQYDPNQRDAPNFNY